LKLDFKDQAAVSPCLKEVRNLDQQGGIKSDQTIWLNADILCGPGGKPANVAFDADLFIETCMRLYGKGVLSLGWKVDLGVSGAFYTEEHCEEMLLLVKKHGLQVKKLVFAVAARPCALNTTHLKGLLKKLPHSELLIWTGFGEPPVSAALIRYLETEFSDFTNNISSNTTASQIPSRISYDVNVSNGYWNSSISESKLMIHRFVHHMDNSNHFFIKKFLSMILPSSFISSTIQNNHDDDDNDDDGYNSDDESDDDGNDANDNHEDEDDDIHDTISNAKYQVKSILKQTIWLSLKVTSGLIFATCIGSYILLGNESPLHRRLQQAPSSQNGGGSKLIKAGVVGAAVTSHRRRK